MRFKWIMFLVLILFFISCGDEKKEEQVDEVKKVKTLDLTQSFDLTFINSDKILTLQKSSNGLKMSDNDKMMFFVFFQTWCDPCKAQLPHIVHLQEKYQDSVRVIGVLMDGFDDDKAIEFVKNYDQTHRFAINFEISNSKNNLLFSKVVDGMSGVPFMVIYNEKGGYEKSFLGATHEEFIEMEFKKVLKKVLE